MKANTTPVRIDNDLYDELKRLAQEDDRSVTVYINRLLRDKVMDKAIDDSVITAYQPKEYKPGDMYDPKHPVKNKSGASPVKVADLFAPEVESDTEMSCCQNKFKPCKHWAWDSASGEGYKNSLSGRFMEVE